MRAGLLSFGILGFDQLVLPLGQVGVLKWVLACRLAAIFAGNLADDIDHRSGVCAESGQREGKPIRAELDLEDRQRRGIFGRLGIPADGRGIGYRLHGKLCAFRQRECRPEYLEALRDRLDGGF
jgi:hypothetical protein